MAYKIISRKTKHKGFWADIEELETKLPSGKTCKWENVVSDDVVAIVAIDKENNIYLSKEWRPAWQKEIVQIPAGMCKYKTEKGIKKQARYELREEIGLDARSWEKMITFFIGQPA